jgi:hypothetical protein
MEEKGKLTSPKSNSSISSSLPHSMPSEYGWSYTGGKGLGRIGGVMGDIGGMIFALVAYLCFGRE